jgi:hypothetical protein
LPVLAFPNLHQPPEWNKQTLYRPAKVKVKNKLCEPAGSNAIPHTYKDQFAIKIRLIFTPFMNLYTEFNERNEQQGMCD